MIAIHKDMLLNLNLILEKHLSHFRIDSRQLTKKNNLIGKKNKGGGNGLLDGTQCLQLNMGFYRLSIGCQWDMQTQVGLLIYTLNSSSSKSFISVSLFHLHHICDWTPERSISCVKKFTDDTTCTHAHTCTQERVFEGHHESTEALMVDGWFPCVWMTYAAHSVAKKNPVSFWKLSTANAT